MRVKIYKKTTFLFFFSFLCLLNWSPFWQISKIPQVNAASETFTSSGTWVVPDGVTSVIVEAWGGGGAAGGGCGGNGDGGGGGAGGQYSKKTITVSVGSPLPYVIGSGGANGGSSGDGGAGGDTTFNSTSVVAKGGVGGLSYANGAAGGIGTTASGIGDTVYSGGGGGNGSGTYAGGGAGGAGSSGIGNNASVSTGGIAKTEYGGAGGNGSISNNAPGNNGSVYGGAGGGATKTGIPGDGAQGFIRLTYNTPPSFTVDTADTPDPINQGNSVTFSATAIDSDNNDWYLAVCKTNSVTSNIPPTCDTDQAYCVSSSSVSSALENNCIWASTGLGNQDWYAFACDNSSIFTACSSTNTVNSPITVIEPTFYSVSVTPDGVISFGTIIAGQSQDTVQLTETRTATSDGNITAKLNIKSSDATNGTSWTLGSSAGENIFVHEFSTTGGEPWTKFTDSDTYETLTSSIGVTDTIDFDLKITTPINSDAIQKTITITVQASAL